MPAGFWEEEDYAEEEEACDSGRDVVDVAPAHVYVKVSFKSVGVGIVLYLQPMM